MKNPIIVSGIKGGVGKSVVARAVAEILREKYGKEVLCYDLDQEIRTLYKFMGERDEKGKLKDKQSPAKGCVSIDLKSEAQRKAFLNAIPAIQDGQFLLADTPAGDGGRFDKMDNEYFLSRSLKELGIEVRFNLLFVLDSGVASVENLRRMVVSYGDAVNWFVVKNFGKVSKESTFAHFEEQKDLIKEIEEAGGEIINWPAMRDAALMEDVERKFIPFKQAADLQHPSLSFIEHSLMSKFYAEINACLEPFFHKIGVI